MTTRVEFRPVERPYSLLDRLGRAHRVLLLLGVSSVGALMPRADLGFTLWVMALIAGILLTSSA